MITSFNKDKCYSSICTLVQFVFVPVQNILNWYKIFCASPIFNFIVQFVVTYNINLFFGAPVCHE